MPSSFELILKIFPSETTASQALAWLKQLERQLPLVDAAVLTKSQQGISRVQETGDVNAWRGALAGALAGGLIGLLGGPAGAILGAAAGAATGGFTAGKLDQGFSDDFLDELRLALQPGASATLVIVERQFADDLIAALHDYPGKLLRHALRSDLAAQVRASQTEDGQQAQESG